MSLATSTLLLWGVWVIWMAILCRKLGISWIPLLPLVAFLVLALAYALIRLARPAGLVMMVVLQLIPAAGTIDLILRPRKRSGR